MLGLGNTAVNRIWEAELNGREKPSQSSSYEEKEAYVRAKYATKSFLARLELGGGGGGGQSTIEQQLVDAVLKMDTKQLAFLLAHATKEPNSTNTINLSFPIKARDNKTLLHLAASRGCLEITQLLLWVMQFTVCDECCLILLMVFSLVQCQR